MRIFFIGASSLNKDSMEKHVLEVWESMGHDVRHINVRDVLQITPKIDMVTRFVIRNLVREPERLSEKKLLRAISEYQPDFIFVILGSMLSPRTMQKIRKIYSGKVVCWCQDQLTTMGRQYLIGCEYDKVFVKDHYLVEMFKDYLDMDVQYLAEACNPTYHKIVELSEDDKKQYKSDIVTYGNLYYYRQAILESLYKYDLRVYGHRPDWMIDRLGDQFMNEGVYEEEKCKVISGATITLNTFHIGEINGLNCRAFEVAGCGGFQLASYTPAISEHFEIGKEIEVFNSRDELLEKVEYYLNNPDKALVIGLAGHKRAYSEHTYEHRLNNLLELSGIKT